MLLLAVVVVVVVSAQNVSARKKESFHSETDWLRRQWRRRRSGSAACRRFPGKCESKKAFYKQIFTSSKRILIEWCYLGWDYNVSLYAS